MSENKYSEDAVRQIIRLAMEKEKEESKVSDPEQGLTIEELISIGKDVGLSEDEIRDAAKKYGSSLLKRTFKVTNTEIIEERFFNSDMEKDALWEHIQFELDDHYGDSTFFGNMTSSTRDYQWKHSSASGVQTKVTLRSEDNGYRLRMSQLVGMAQPIWEGISIGIIPALFFLITLIAGFDQTSVLKNTLLTGGFWALSSYVIYKMDVAWRKKKHRKLKELANTLVLDVMGSDSNTSNSENKSQTKGEIEIEGQDVYSGDDQTISSKTNSKEMN